MSYIYTLTKSDVEDALSYGIKQKGFMIIEHFQKNYLNKKIVLESGSDVLNTWVYYNLSNQISGSVFSYKLAYDILVEMAISTNSRNRSQNVLIVGDYSILFYKILFKIRHVVNNYASSPS